MSPVSLAFLVAIVVFSGFVAYWGDLLGRRLGKKRLTIGRLRPRHTAALMTGIFGSAATAFAIMVLSGLSAPVRTWIVEGNRAQEALVQVRKRLDKTQTDLGGSQKDLASTRSTLKQEQSRLKSLGTKVVTAEKEVKTLRSIAGNLREVAATIRGELSRARSNLQSVQVRYKELLSRSRVLGENNRTIVRQNSELSAQNVGLQIEVGANEKKIREQTKELESLRSTISDLTARLERISSEASRDLGKLRDQIDALDAERRKAEGDRDAAQALVQQAKVDYQNVLREMQRRGLVSRLNAIVFQHEDELARIPVGPSLSAAEARVRILAVLEASSNQAKARGAGLVPGTNDHAGLMDRLDQNGKTVSVAEQMALAVSELAGKPVEQVILARSFMNRFRGEEVALTLRVFKNPVVYPIGTVIGETRIDGRLTEDAILASISAYVRNELAPKALSDGMIQATGKPEPLGEIPADRLLEVVRAAIGASRVIRLQFVASQDTRAADQLKLELRLR